MAVKVDLEKAYDWLNWDFIIDKLQNTGIPYHLIMVIMKCFMSTTMQVSLNGELTDEFKPTRGV